VGAMVFNMQAKLKRDDDLALVIQMIWIEYVKAFKSSWMERD
jgi:hypothetical protein